MATSIRPTAVKQRRPARVRSSSDPGPLESREEEEENGSVAAVYNSSKTWSSSGVVYVSLPVKLSSLLGAACFVWLCLDPVVLHGADRGSPSLLVPSFLQKDKQEDHRVPRPAVLVAQPEAIYLRHVVYNHDKALGETGFGMAPPGERNNSTSTAIVTKAEGRRNNKRVVVPPLSSKLRQSNIRDSEEYRGLDILVEKRDDDCQVKYAWQRNNRQNCNSMHEATDLTTRPTAVVPVLVASTTEKEQSTTTTTRAAAAAATTTMVVNRYQFLTHGYFRDVFMLLLDEQHFLQHHHNNKQQQPPPQNKIVFKPMRYEHDFEYRNFDRMRRDALTMDQLTGARHILNIYGNCGTSGLFEYADGGDIETAIWPNKVVVDNNSTAEEEYHREPSKVLTQMEKLHIATQAAMGLASLHNMDEEGRASVAHTDISPGQFIKVNGVYKLNDFNRARFLKYSKSDDAYCPFYNWNNWGKNRAPEEYLYGPESEMVDVYSLGNIMYMLLQGEWPFDAISDDEAAEAVANGGKPPVDDDIWDSKDPVGGVLKQAMIMCHAHEVSERKSARQVETYLKDSMRKLDPGRLEEWGDA